MWSVKRQLFVFVALGLAAVAAFGQFAATAPGDAAAGLQERDVAIRPQRGLTQLKEYFRGDEKVLERMFYSDGQMAEEYLLKGGKANGLCRQFYESGKVFCELPYRDGELDGNVRYFKENGELLGESRFDKGTGILRQFPLKSLELDDEVVPYKNGEEDGDKITFGHFAGVQGMGCLIMQYLDGNAEGWDVTFNEDGSVESLGYMHESKSDGVACDFDSTGAPKAGFPKFFISDQEVSEADFRLAAKSNPRLAKSLNEAPYWISKLATEVEKTRVTLFGNAAASKP